jgi:hypothetical protein
VLGAALLATVPFMLKFAKHAGEDKLYAAYQPWVLAAGLVLLIGGGLGLLYARNMQRDLTVLVLAIAGFAGTELMMAGFEPIAQARAGTNLMPALRAAGAANPATKVYSVGIYEQSLTFYLRRTVTLVDYTDEFAFGLEQQPQLSIPSMPAWIEQWQRDAAAGVKDVAITRPEIVAELQRQGVLLRVIGADGRRSIIVNH